MIGILVIIAVSWILLYIIEKKSILALGLLPISRRLQQFGVGFLITCFLCVLVQFSEVLISKATILINPELNILQILNMLFWDLKSVVTEELIFRGAILYILMKKIGNQKSILISAIAFGVYHWFSFGIFGNIIPMTVVLIGTGLMGYAWALAFLKTKSIAMPIGLHLGWNFTFNTIFSKGPLGKGILFIESNEMIPSWFSLIGLWIVPIIILLFVRKFVSAENT